MGIFLKRGKGRWKGEGGGSLVIIVDNTIIKTIRIIIITIIATITTSDGNDDMDNSLLT